MKLFCIVCYQNSRYIEVIGSLMHAIIKYVSNFVKLIFVADDMKIYHVQVFKIKIHELFLLLTRYSNIEFVHKGHIEYSSYVLTI